MDIAISNIVRSTAGRDKGDLFFVLATEGDFLLLADGKRRRVEDPKRKRRKHTELCGESHSPVAEKIRSASPSFEPSPSMGVTPVVNDTVAQRGMANSGPIVRYRRQVKKMP